MPRVKRRSAANSEVITLVRRERTKKADPQFNTALARGLEVLMSFREGERHLSNAELHERTEIPKATLSRLTYTLCKMGFLRLVETTGQYELMPPVLALGYKVLANVGLPTLAQPFMAEIARDCGGSVGLAVRDGHSIIFLESVRGPAAPANKVLAGTKFPVAQTALGWAILAALPEAEREALKQEIRLANPAAWHETERVLARAMKEVETQGFCVGLGQMVPTINSAAVPYRHPDGGQIFAFSCYGSASTMGKDSMYSVWGPRLLDLTRRLSGGGA